MTHRDLPAAPYAIVSGISCIAQLPTIIDARAGRARQLTLEIMLSEEFQLQDDIVQIIADYCGASVKDVAVRLAPGPDIIVIVEVSNTTFDFDYLFGETKPALAARGDSDESWTASQALAAARAS